MSFTIPTDFAVTGAFIAGCCLGVYIADSTREERPQIVIPEREITHTVK